LLNRRHWAVLLLAAAFAQVSTLLLDAASPVLRFGGPRSPDTSSYLVLSAVFAAAAVVLPVALELNRYFLLLPAAMFCPYVMQLAFSGVFRSGFGTNLLRLPTPAHLAVLFVPPVLLACWVVLTAIGPGRSRAAMSSGQEA
jgi:hypothetical protein